MLVIMFRRGERVRELGTTWAACGKRRSQSHAGDRSINAGRPASRRLGRRGAGRPRQGIACRRRRPPARPSALSLQQVDVSIPPRPPTTGALMTALWLMYASFCGFFFCSCHSDEMKTLKDIATCGNKMVIAEHK